MEMRVKESTSAANADNEICVNVRSPKRILHFSDGTMEEYSDDEEDSVDGDKTVQRVDESQMGWGPWMTYKTVRAGTNLLAVCDYLGETLATIFGITTPKYKDEIEEHNREYQEEKVKMDQEYAGWRDQNEAAGGDTNQNIIHVKEKF